MRSMLSGTMQREHVHRLGCCRRRAAARISNLAATAPRLGLVHHIVWQDLAVTNAHPSALAIPYTTTQALGGLVQASARQVSKISLR